MQFVVVVIVIDMAGFILNAAGFVRAVRSMHSCQWLFTSQLNRRRHGAGMIRGDGTDIAAKVAGGVRVIVIDVGSPVDDPADLLRAVRVGTFAPVVLAVLAPLAVVVGMGRVMERS